MTNGTDVRSQLDSIKAQLAADQSKTVHDAKFGDILRTGWCTYYFGADNAWHNARTGEVIEELETLEEERQADDEPSVWLTDSTAHVSRLLAALDAVERECQYLDTLADGDRHYAAAFRKVVADALEASK